MGSYPAEDTFGSYAGLTRISSSVPAFSSSSCKNGQECHTSRIRCSSVDLLKTRQVDHEELHDSQLVQADQREEQSSQEHDPVGECRPGQYSGWMTKKHTRPEGSLNWLK